jgi:hypothetical protein
MARPGFTRVQCSRCPKAYFFGGPYTETVCPTCYPAAAGLIRTPEQQARLERDFFSVLAREEPVLEELQEATAA